MCIFRGQAPSCLSYLRHFHTQNSEDILPPPFVAFPLPKTKCCLAQIDAAVVVVVVVLSLSLSLLERFLFLVGVGEAFRKKWKKKKESLVLNV